jgi:phosphoglycolate phosphatase
VVPTAVIFDCDGVLFDSWRANVAYYDAIRRELALPPMGPEWERLCHILAASEVLDRMLAGDPALLARARAVARTIDYGPFYALMEPVPGLHDVLGDLGRRHRLAMATNRGRTVPEVVRRFGLGQHLVLAVGVHDVARPKPHPDMIELCLARLGVAPARAVYVGDAQTDLAAARAAGVHFVAVGDVAWSPHAVETLDALPPLVDAILAR